VSSLSELEEANRGNTGEGAVIASIKHWVLGKIDSLQSKWIRWKHPNNYQHYLDLDISATELEFTKSASGFGHRLTEVVRRFANVDHSTPALSMEEVVDAKFISDMFSISERKIQLKLTDIETMSGSKSDLWTFDSLYEFGKCNYNRHRHRDFKRYTESEYFQFCFDGGLSESGSNFRITDWDRQLCVMNNGGSHRLSTAYYIARRDNIDIDIDGHVRIYKINKSAWESLNQDHHVFLVETLTPYQWRNLLKDDGRASTIWLEPGDPFSRGYETRRALMVLTIRRDQKVSYLTKQLISRLKAQNIPSLDNEKLKHWLRVPNKN